MAVSDDDIIRKKLLIEGDGGMDDKRINNFVKVFIKWCNSPPGDADSEQIYERMMAILAQCEYSMQKSLLVYQMNLTEQKNYDQLSQIIEENLEKAKQKIVDCKSELIEAKSIRRNRQEYDSLAKIIQQQPDRQDTISKLTELDKELEGYSTTTENLQQKLELRKKQFHVLVSAIHELQRILEDDEQRTEEEMEVAS